MKNYRIKPSKGEKVYIGIDVHNLRWAVTAVTTEAELRGGPRISDSLLRWISQLFEESTDEQKEAIFSDVQGQGCS